MEKFRHILAMIQKLQRLEVEKMGQILCVKKVPFRKSGHIYYSACLPTYTVLWSSSNFSLSSLNEEDLQRNKDLSYFENKDFVFCTSVVFGHAF